MAIATSLSLIHSSQGFLQKTPDSLEEKPKRREGITHWPHAALVLSDLFTEILFFLSGSYCTSNVLSSSRES